MKAKYFYLIHIQYLGYRFHGWAKQPTLKTVHQMVDKTIAHALGHKDFKTLGGSRTDAKVSANEFALELFTNEAITGDFFTAFDKNLPPDIRALSIQEVSAEFNIIKSPKTKEYLYLFAFGQKAHPFSAPFITTIIDPLNIELMKQGAGLFEGTHDFRAYCKQPKEQTQTLRSIALAKIEVNDIYKANFFPEESWMLRIKAKGFLRHQIRLIMGQLFLLGQGKTTLDEIRRSLENPTSAEISYVAPASGLILNKVEYK